MYPWRSENQCEGDNVGDLEPSRPWRFIPHGLWYWYILMLHKVHLSEAGCWVRSSWLLSNPFLSVHQCWICKLLGRAWNGSALNSLSAMTGETCSMWESSGSLRNLCQMSVSWNRFCWLSWRTRAESKRIQFQKWNHRRFGTTSSLLDHTRSIHLIVLSS